MIEFCIMPMTISRCFLKLLPIIIAITLVSACDSGTKGSGQETQEKQETRQLSFVDASKGLPATGLWRQGIAFSDLNHDDQIDIVAPPPRKAAEKYAKPVAWYGNGRGEWSEARLEVPDIVYNYGSVAVADFDSDGIPDIVLAMHGASPSLKALRGVGQGRYVDFSEGLPSGKEIRSRALVIADINNDGAPDIVALSERPVFGAKDTRQSPLWGCYRIGEKWKCEPFGNEKEMRWLFGDQLSTGDVNGDGNKDIALGSLAAQNSRIVWLGDGKGGFVPFNGGLPQEKIYYAVALADINRDGRDDLIASISGFGEKAFVGLKAFLSRPDTFEEISEGLPGHMSFTALTASDLDGDGIPEIIGATVKEGLKIFSYKKKRWQEMDVSGLPEAGLRRVYNVYCLDLNGDGLKDIAFNYALEGTGGGIRVFYNASNKGLRDKGQ